VAWRHARPLRRDARRVWLYHSTGVIRSDVERNIYIPEQLTMPLQVKAAYDGAKIHFRYRWLAARPGGTAAGT
jgi:hypothetical protein